MEELMESLHYLLMKTHTVLQRRIVSRAAGLGLTPGQPKILDYLLRYGESDQKTIASYCEPPLPVCLADTGGGGCSPETDAGFRRCGAGSRRGSLRQRIGFL